MKFNKNEFGWKEKVSVNTDELVTKNDIPHYNETLMFEISGDDYNSFTNNSYFNMNVLNLDETKSYVGKEKIDINSAKYIYNFVYDKENDTLICEGSQMYIYNHKSYNGEDFIEDENSAVLKLSVAPMDISEFEGEGYFRLYEVDKLELDNNYLSNDVSIKNSLTVGTRIGDIGKHSVAEGYQNTASGESSHAEGNSTTASGNLSHAEGDWTVASGYYSHAEGTGSTASGEDSHAEGKGTKASSGNQHVQGKYNIEDTENKYAHIVGNGTSNTKRSNAHTLDWNGNGWYQGELYTGGTSQSDANKVLTTANISFNESGELVVTINGVTKTFVPKQ